MAGYVPPHEHIMQSSVELVRRIKTNELTSSLKKVFATITVLKDIINYPVWNTAKELRNIIMLNGQYLTDKLPMEETIGNMIRRMLDILRRVHFDLKQKHKLKKSSCVKKTKATSSKHKNGRSNDYNMILPSLRAALLRNLINYQGELEKSDERILNQAAEVFDDHEIVVTVGKSKLVEEFLKEVSKTKDFEVLVAESSPLLSGHEMAYNLANADVQSVLVPDELLFSRMRHVNKLIIGANAVMGDGYVRTVSNVSSYAIAAKRYRVPVWVIMPIYKLSPRVLDYCDRQQLNEKLTTFTGVKNSVVSNLRLKREIDDKYCYIPPKHISFYYTNMYHLGVLGDGIPTEINALVRQLYNPNDIDFNQAQR